MTRKLSLKKNKQRLSVSDQKRLDNDKATLKNVTRLELDITKYINIVLDRHYVKDDIPEPITKLSRWLEILHAAQVIKAFMLKELKNETIDVLPQLTSIKFVDVESHVREGDKVIPFIKVVIEGWKTNEQRKEG